MKTPTERNKTPRKPRAAERPRVLFVAPPAPCTRRLLTLFRRAGATVEAAWIGADSAPDVRRPDFDLIALDAFDPATAILMLGAWRRDGLTTPVLFIADGASVARCLDDGADACVAQTVSVRELRARLSALVRRRTATRPHVIEVYDLRIDTIEKKVERAGRPIELTPREYALLEYLALQRGRVVSQQSIWEHVFGEPGGRGGSNVLAVHIRSLRQKIDRGFGVKLILTRHGFGYLLRDHERAADR